MLDSCVSRLSVLSLFSVKFGSITYTLPASNTLGSLTLSLVSAGMVQKESVSGREVDEKKKDIRPSLAFLPSRNKECASYPSSLFESLKAYA